MLLVCRDAQEVSKCFRGILCVFVSRWGWRQRRWVSFVAGGFFLVLRRRRREQNTHTSHTEIKKGKKYIYLYVYVCMYMDEDDWVLRLSWQQCEGWKQEAENVDVFCHVLTHPRGHWAEKKSDKKKKKTVSEWQNLMLRYIPISFLSSVSEDSMHSESKNTHPLPPEQTDKPWISRICIQISEWQVSCSWHAERQSVHWVLLPVLFCGKPLFVA